jgi:hypothetical protein
MDDQGEIDEIELVSQTNKSLKEMTMYSGKHSFDHSE